MERLYSTRMVRRVEVDEFGMVTVSFLTGDPVDFAEGTAEARELRMVSLDFGVTPIAIGTVERYNPSRVVDGADVTTIEWSDGAVAVFSNAGLMGELQALDDVVAVRDEIEARRGADLHLGHIELDGEPVKIELVSLPGHLVPVPGIVIPAGEDPIATGELAAEQALKQGYVLGDGLLLDGWHTIEVEVVVRP